MGGLWCSCFSFSSLHGEAAITHFTTPLRVLPLQELERPRLLQEQHLPQEPLPLPQPLLLLARSGYVAELDGDAKAFKDHGDSVLGVLNLLVPTVAADEYLDGVLGDSRGGSWGLCLTHLSCRSESSNKSL